MTIEPVVLVFYITFSILHEGSESKAPICKLETYHKKSSGTVLPAVYSFVTSMETGNDKRLIKALYFTTTDR